MASLRATFPGEPKTERLFFTRAATTFALPACPETRIGAVADVDRGAATPAGAPTVLPMVVMQISFTPY
ncbi:hypothetical protein B8W66_15160 [Mycobacterium decipiens]|uniref:Uncharacterized protein n=1 Tax=Mycobacterium decipiens TaxID=1430326 RepID=A0A1X2LSU3_9MYCO|nr:hypothetical protein B8W66_15160 [Mycobacterium decipiens]